jgi:hypothetical protein
MKQKETKTPKQSDYLSKLPTTKLPIPTRPLPLIMIPEHQILGTNRTLPSTYDGSSTVKEMPGRKRELGLDKTGGEVEDLEV